MLIGFVGDVHGRVFHMIVAVAMWQRMAETQLDLIIQVGDLGAYPDVSRMDAATRAYLATDPSEADFERLLHARGQQAERLVRLRQMFTYPIHFVRGNHEDVTWLRSLSIDSVSGTARVDPFVRYTPDGTVLRFQDVLIAFLGGEDASGDTSIDPEAYQTLVEMGMGKIDVLVTHDAP